MQDCRLIVEGSHSESSSFRLPGALNMAIDEVLLQSAAESGKATLRFYGWDPATLSLGYFQKLADRIGHPASQDCEIVRRASGGGAIMHDRELTYSFAAPTRSRWGGAETMYLAFHETLVETLAELEIETQLHPNTGLRDEAFLCFQRRASGDVVCQGHKVAGSAQRRWKNALMQHGSLLLARSTHAPELPGLFELAGFCLESDTIIRNWLHKLASRLKVNFLPGQLTDNETSRAHTLQDEKFSRASWIGRR